MQMRTKVMPGVFTFALSVVMMTTVTRADTSFFWDDFDRDVLEDTDVHWEAASSYLEDGNLLVDPADNETGGGAQALLAPLSDFSIRTRVNFGGTEHHGSEPWFGVWFRDVSFFVEPGIQYWGGIDTNGFSSAHTTSSNPNPINNNFNWALDSSDTYDRDINLQFDAIGDRIELFAWYDGTEKPTEPQTTVDDRTRYDSTAFGIILNRTNFERQDIIPDQRASVRYYAVLPAVTGDFNASDKLDVEDINLIDEELRGESTNRVFDLTEDGLVTGEDRRILIQDLMGTSFGDSNLDGMVDFADFLKLSQGFNADGGWANGDFDGSGRVEFPDFLLLSGNFGQSNAAAASVPEPASALLLVIGLAMGITNIRHRRA